MEGNDKMFAEYPFLQPPGDILFASNNEDGASELLLLDELAKKASSGLNALIVTGGGDNFLSVLAHPAVDFVKTVDMNPVQLALAQLKLELACSSLSVPEVLTFMGTYDKTELVPMDRRQLFETHLKPKLSDDTVKVIEEQLMREIEIGFNKCGTLDNFNRYLFHKFEQQGFTADALAKGLVAKDKLEGLLLGDRPLVSVDEFFKVTQFASKVPTAIVEHCRDILCRGGYQTIMQGYCDLIVDGVESPITKLMFFQYYTDECYPHWLQSSSRQTLRIRKSRVEFCLGGLTDTPEDKSNSYHLVSPSNIYDWVPQEKAVEGIQALVDKYLHSDGYLLLRLGFGGLCKIAKGLSGSLKVCSKLSPEVLAKTEKSFFYKNTDRLGALQSIEG